MRRLSDFILNMGLPPSTSPKDRSVWRHIFAGSAFALTIVACVLCGVWIDKHWGTDPWGALVGAIVGIVAGTYNLINEFKDEYDP